MGGFTVVIRVVFNPLIVWVAVMLLLLGGTAKVGTVIINLVSGYGPL